MFLEWVSKLFNQCLLHSGQFPIGPGSQSLKLILMISQAFLGNTDSWETERIQIIFLFKGTKLRNISKFQFSKLAILRIHIQVILFTVATVIL